MIKMLRGLKIRGKLLVMAIPLIALLAILAVLYTAMLQYIYTTSEDVYFEQLYGINDRLTTADRDYYQAYCAILKNVMGQAFLTGNLEEYVVEFHENSQQTLDQVNEVAEMVRGLPEIEAFEHEGMTMLQQYDEFIKYNSQIEDMVSGGIGRKILQTYVPVFDNARAAIKNMETIIEAYAIKEKDEMEASMSKMALTLFITIFVFVIIVTLFVFRIVKYIKDNLMKITKEIQLIAQKDLTSTLEDMEGADEIVQLNKAAKQLQDNLTHAMQTMKATAGNLSASSMSMATNINDSVESVQSIDLAASELAKTATQQAKDTTDVANEMSAINSISKDTLDNAEKLLAACTDIKKDTGEGKETVTELTDITEKSLAAYTSIFEAINTIGEKIKAIGVASNMISDIASQTNLLSLNASIEAARAGDAGKGFAVVAEEIGKLAQQSAESATTINGMINELVNSSNVAIESSETVKKFVERQKESVAKTETVFNRIDDGMVSMNTGVAKVEKVSAELGDRVSNVSDLIESLSAASEENAATAQELSATTTVVTDSITSLQTTGSEVGSDSNKLNGIVNEYRLDK